jgi:rhamnosyltransferase
MFEKVSIVIPTKNGGALFREVLAGIKNQEFCGNIEIIVVDSGSVDDTITCAQSYGAHVVSVPPETFNHGNTRNKGVEISSGEIVVLMTQDAVPGDSLLIHNLVIAFHDQKVAGAYARQLPREDADIFTKRNLNNWLTGRTDSETRQITDWNLYKNMNPITQYMFCNFDNVCSALRRSVWENIPFPKSDFGEDIAWCKTVLEAGWKITYQSSAIVVHSHDRSFIYEFKRTYMCHRKLYEMFKLQTIPTPKYVFVSVFNAIYKDWLYAVKSERNYLKLLTLIIKAVPLSIASVLGQYMGARDEKLSLLNKVSGV